VDLLAPHLDSIIQTLGSVRSSHRMDDNARLFFTVIDSLACLPSDRVKEVLRENESVTDQVYEKGFLGLTKKAQLKATEVRRSGEVVTLQLNHFFASVSRAGHWAEKREG
jgi:hypothetical protein